jgi:hypothetical protein
LGEHSVTRTNVNSEENYIYFKDSNLPSAIVTGASYIYADGIGSVGGIGDGNLIFAEVESSQRLAFVDDQDNRISLDDSLQGGVSLNTPVVFDNILNINASTPNSQAVKYLTAGDPLENLVSGDTY